MGNYTELLENKLFTQWSDFEEDEDYERMIEFINSDSGFKTFGEGLIYIISKKYPDVDSENVIEFIYECCDKNEVKKESIASSNTFKNWFKSDSKPKKGEQSRDAMFALAFALELNPDETADLFHKVYMDRAFDFRNTKEIIYYFCISQDKSWEDAQKLIKLADISDHSSDDKTIYTSLIGKELSEISDESELISYIKSHCNNLSKSNITAKENMEKLVEKAKEIAREEMTLPEFESLYDNKWRKEESFSTNLLYEIITGVSPSSDKGTISVFKNSRLPKEIKNRFPESSSFSVKNQTYESIRKMIILLFSYTFWFKIQHLKVDADFDDYKEELNALLFDCSFSELYYGNPYDWLFMYCALNERPLDVFRGALSEVLTEE